jgi:hypothetical protein
VIWGGAEEDATRMFFSVCVCGLCFVCRILCVMGDANDLYETKKGGEEPASSSSLFSV